MPRKRYHAEEIIPKPREAEVLLSQGKSLPPVLELVAINGGQVSATPGYHGQSPTSRFYILRPDVQV